MRPQLAIPFPGGFESSWIGFKYRAQLRPLAVERADPLEVKLRQPPRRQTTVGEGRGDIREREFTADGRELAAHGNFRDRQCGGGRCH